VTRKNIVAKLLLNNLNRILKSERTTIGGLDEKKEKVRLRVWNDTEDHTKE
jgi:DNA repair protein RadC